MLTVRSKLHSLRLVIAYCLAGLAFTCEAQNAGASEWKRYELGKGSFCVLLPGPPTEAFTPSPPSLDVPVDNYTYSLKTEQAVFVATYSFLGEGAEKWQEGVGEAFLQGLWNGISSGFDQQMEASKLPHRTTLVNKRKVSFSGYDGQEIIFTLGALQGRILITRVGRHVFSAMVLRSEKTAAADVENFFSSFAISQIWLTEHKQTK